MSKSKDTLIYTRATPVEAYILKKYGLGTGKLYTAYRADPESKRWRTIAHVAGKRGEWYKVGIFVTKKVGPFPTRAKAAMAK